LNVTNANRDRPAITRYVRGAGQATLNFLRIVLADSVTCLKPYDGLITAVATVFLVIATLLLAWIAWQTDHTLNKTLVSSSRAWIGPRNVRSDAAPMVNMALDLYVDYQNTGREPAFNLTHSMDVFTATLEEDQNGTVDKKLAAFLNTCRSVNKADLGGVIYPSTGFANYTLNFSIKPELIDDQLIKGMKFLLVQGCFVYKTFDMVRHSYFCYFYKEGLTKPANYNICQAAQYAD
jgi:hypothetical protein